MPPAPFKHATGDTIVVAGDLNLVFNLDLDKKGGNRRTNFKAREKCLELMGACDLFDVWRDRNPCVKNFTWSSNVTPGIHCRLDYFLLSRYLQPFVTNIEFAPGLQSDHSFVLMSFSFGNTSRGRGYWKLNNSLLYDSVYVDSVKDLIRNELSSKNFDNPASRWEFLKYKIRTYSMSYSRYKAKERREKENQLTNKIASLEQRLYISESPELRSQLKEAQKELMH